MRSSRIISAEPSKVITILPSVSGVFAGIIYLLSHPGQYSSASSKVLQNSQRCVNEYAINVLHVLAEHLLAMLACEHHFGGLSKHMILVLLVALRAVVPFLTAWSANGDLSVQNMLTHDSAEKWTNKYESEITQTKLMTSTAKGAPLPATFYLSCLSV